MSPFNFVSPPSVLVNPPPLNLNLDNIYQRATQGTFTLPSTGFNFSGANFNPVPRFPQSGSSEDNRFLPQGSQVILFDVVPGGIAPSIITPGQSTGLNLF